MDAVYMVTGAAGHLGNTLVRKLVAAGKYVRALCLPGENTEDLAPQVEIFRGDVCVPDSMEAFFANPNGEKRILIHAAGVVSIASKYDRRVYDVNVGGTRNIIALCRRYGVDKLVYVSSVHAIPEKPQGQVMTEVGSFDRDAVVGLYAQTKAEASQLVLDAAQAGLDAVVVQPSGIIGPYDFGRGHLTQMVVDFVKGSLRVCVKGGYDFVDVRDVADGILACCEKGRKGECYILSNRYFSVGSILNALQKLTKRKPIRTVLPLWFARLTAPLAELYYKCRKQPPLFTRYSLYTLSSNAHFSHEKATRELGYHPKPMGRTLKDTVCWLHAYGRV